MRPVRYDYYLQIAEVVATRSTCQRRRVGCVITSENGRILATGYNGVPANYPHCRDNIDSNCPGKDCVPGEGLNLCEAIHAEQNALIQLSDVDKAYRCFSTASPCIHCVKMLLNTPIMYIYYYDEYPHPEAREMWDKMGRYMIRRMR